MSQQYQKFIRGAPNNQTLIDENMAQKTIKGPIATPEISNNHQRIIVNELVNQIPNNRSNSRQSQGQFQNQMTQNNNYNKVNKQQIPTVVQNQKRGSQQNAFDDGVANYMDRNELYKNNHQFQENEQRSHVDQNRIQSHQQQRQENIYHEVPSKNLTNHQISQSQKFDQKSQAFNGVQMNQNQSKDLLKNSQEKQGKVTINSLVQADQKGNQSITQSQSRNVYQGQTSESRNFYQDRSQINMQMDNQVNYEMQQKQQIILQQQSQQPISNQQISQKQVLNTQNKHSTLISGSSFNNRQNSQDNRTKTGNGPQVPNSVILQQRIISGGIPQGQQQSFEGSQSYKNTINQQKNEINQPAIFEKNSISPKMIKENHDEIEYEKNINQDIRQIRVPSGKGLQEARQKANTSLGQHSPFSSENQIYDVTNKLVSTSKNINLDSGKKPGRDTALSIGQDQLKHRSSLTQLKFKNKGNNLASGTSTQLISQNQQSNTSQGFHQSRSVKPQQVVSQTFQLMAGNLKQEPKKNKEVSKNITPTQQPLPNSSILGNIATSSNSNSRNQSRGPQQQTLQQNSDMFNNSIGGQKIKTSSSNNMVNNKSTPQRSQVKFNLDKSNSVMIPAGQNQFGIPSQNELTDSKQKQQAPVQQINIIKSQQNLQALNGQVPLMQVGAFNGFLPNIKSRNPPGNGVYGVKGATLNNVNQGLTVQISQQKMNNGLLQTQGPGSGRNTQNNSLLGHGLTMKSGNSGSMISDLMPGMTVVSVNGKDGLQAMPTTLSLGGVSGISGDTIGPPISHQMSSQQIQNLRSGSYSTDDLTDENNKQLIDSQNKQQKQTNFITKPSVQNIQSRQQASSAMGSNKQINDFTDSENKNQNQQSEQQQDNRNNGYTSNTQNQRTQDLGQQNPFYMMQQSVGMGNQDSGPDGSQAGGPALQNQRSNDGNYNNLPYFGGEGYQLNSSKDRPSAPNQGINRPQIRSRNGLLQQQVARTTSGIEGKSNQILNSNQSSQVLPYGVKLNVTTQGTANQLPSGNLTRGENGELIIGQGNMPFSSLGQTNQDVNKSGEYTRSGSGKNQLQQSQTRSASENRVASSGNSGGRNLQGTHSVQGFQHTVGTDQSPNKTINQSTGSNLHHHHYFDVSATNISQQQSVAGSQKTKQAQSNQSSEFTSNNQQKQSVRKNGSDQNQNPQQNTTLVAATGQMNNLSLAQDSSQNLSQSNLKPRRLKFYVPQANNLQIGHGSNLQSFQQAKISDKRFGVVKSFAANTHVGLVRKANEDRIAIILNVIQPVAKTQKVPEKEWPKIQIFAVYDGHGGNQCAEYLKEHLHNNIIMQPEFPSNVHQAILKGSRMTDRTYIEKVFHEYQVTQKIQNCKSGSCANVIMTFNDDLYVINVGDSRAIGSKNFGQMALDLSEDHKPGEVSEFKRIEAAGGHIYQTHSVINAAGQPCLQQIRVDQPPVEKYTMDNPLIGPYRVFPGRLSVCRTFGDLEAKHPSLGGNPNVVIAEPDVNFQKDGCKKLDYVLTCSDGIFDKLTTQEVHDLIWSRISMHIQDKAKTVHQIIGYAVDEVLHSSARTNSLDNISVVMIAFEPLIQLIESYRD